MRLHSASPLLGSFPLTHTSTRSDYSERRGALHTERIQCRRLCSIPSAEPYCACRPPSPPPALSFHVSLLRCDEWGVRGKMFSGVFIRDCCSQGVNLAVTKNDSVSHTCLPPRRPRFKCLKRGLSKSKGGGETCSVVPRPERNKNKLAEPVWSQFRCRSGPRTVLCLPVKWTHKEEAMG